MINRTTRTSTTPATTAPASADRVEQRPSSPPSTTTRGVPSGGSGAPPSVSPESQAAGRRRMRANEQAVRWRERSSAEVDGPRIEAPEHKIKRAGAAGMTKVPSTPAAGNLGSAGTSHSSTREAPSRSDRRTTMTDTKPPPRTPGLAVAEAEELLAGGLRSESVMEGGVVVSDPRDVNHDGKTVADQFRELEARSMVEKNAPLEQEALQKLTPEQRAQYENVRSSVEDADDPMALLSLQKMLLKGELPGEQAIGGDQDVLDGLSQLVTQPLAPGIDRSQLLTDAVQEMATPAAVSQHQKGTCAASSVVIALLRENPAEYLRLVSGLSSPEGTVALANGDTLRREPGMEGDDGSGRSVPHRLLAPAMMEYGDPKRNYINSWDRRVGGVGDIQGGLDADSVQRLLGGVFGREFDMLYDPQTQRVGDSDWVTTLGRLAEGEPVVATLVWGGGAHMVTVVGVKETNGERFVEVINPWGQTERVPEAEFRENLVWVNVPERREPAPGGGGGGSW